MPSCSTRPGTRFGRSSVASVARAADAIGRAGIRLACPDGGLNITACHSVALACDVARIAPPSVVAVPNGRVTCRGRRLGAAASEELGDDFEGAEALEVVRG